MYPGANYARSCPLCGFLEAPKPEWDDTLPAVYCPNDGMQLERLSCYHCDAPVQISVRSGFFGMVRDVVGAACCTQCGQLVNPVEPQMRRAPRTGGASSLIIRPE